MHSNAFKFYQFDLALYADLMGVGGEATKK